MIEAISGCMIGLLCMAVFLCCIHYSLVKEFRRTKHQIVNAMHEEISRFEGEARRHAGDAKVSNRQV